MVEEGKEFEEAVDSGRRWAGASPTSEGEEEEEEAPVGQEHWWRQGKRTKRRWAAGSRQWRTRATMTSEAEEEEEEAWVPHEHFQWRQ